MAQVFRSAAIDAARIVGESRELTTAAEEVAVEVRSRAAATADTGRFASSIDVATDAGPRGVLDRVVVSDDPGAIAIEYGWTTPAGRRVPGQHAFTDTLNRRKSAGRR